MNTHLVTGATGFVGGALVLALLDQTDDEVIAVARGGNGDQHGFYGMSGLPTVLPEKHLHQTTLKFCWLPARALPE